MASQQIAGISPIRIDRMSGTRLPNTMHQHAHTPAANPPVPTVRHDQVSISAGGLALNRLVRMWGSLTGLFGTGQAQTWKGPDLSALREALQQARQNAEAVELRDRVTNTLKSTALRQAESLVEQYYGLKGDGTTVRVKYENNLEGALASVSFQYDDRGRIANPSLHINMSQFAPDTGPNGVNSHVIQNDRIIAHEMTHLIMGRNMDLASLPDWFAEGTAEYISGGAERVALSLRNNSPEALLSTLMKPWAGDSDSYAAAYLAVRFLDQAAAEGGGLKAIMGRLKEGDTLDQAIASISQGRYQDSRHFLTDFARMGTGAAYMRTIDLSGRDPGSIKPGAGPSVVADRGVKANQPLEGFRIQWPSPLEGLPALKPAF
ncbi:MAG: flagellin/flagellar hook associated protein [Symbiobacteriaceae bacterium]|nr:flagellin/flagellar hook associated protein [Symbiobacteriaceae bacterium]